MAFTRKGGGVIVIGMLCIVISMSISGYLTLFTLLETFAIGFGQDLDESSVYASFLEHITSFGIAFDFNIVVYLAIVGVVLVLGVLIGYPIFQFFVHSSSLSITREISSIKVFAGDFLLVKVTVRNNSFNIAPILTVSDAYPEVFELALGQNFTQIRLNPYSSISFSYVLRTTVRGPFKLGPTKLVVSDRFGFFSDERTILEFTNLLVYPSYEDIRRLEIMSSKRQAGLLFGIHRTKLKGIGGEFVGLRPYSVGDQIRLINWKASTRAGNVSTGDLIINEFETEQNTSVIIFLNISFSMDGGLPRNTKLEYAIRSALLVAYEAWRNRDVVGLVVYSDKVYRYLEPKSEGEIYQVLFELLARIRVRGREDLLQAVKYVNNRVTKSSYFVILSDLEDNKENIIEAIKWARGRKHQVSLLSPFGPWFEIVSHELTTFDRTVGRVIAQGLLNRRKTLNTEVRRQGVSLISVGPQDFLPAVLAEFKRKKSRV